MTAPRKMPAAIARFVAIVVLSLAPGRVSLAQTTQPALPPPAVNSAFESETISRSVVVPASADGKASPAIPAPGNPLDIRRVGLSLVIVLALIFAFRFAARWMFPAAGVGRSSQVIKVLSRSVVAPKQQFLLVQVGRRLVLVGDCGTQMSSLAEITDPDEVAALMGQLGSDRVAAAEPQTRFAPLLGRATRAFEEPAGPEEGMNGEMDRQLATATAAIETADEEEFAGAPRVDATGVDATRGELNGLTEKIRLLSRQLGRL